MNLDTSKWSQADYVTGVALLSAEAGRLEATLGQRILPDQLPPRPALKGGGGNAISDFALMAAHVTKLNQLTGLHGETARVNRISTSSAGAGVPDPSGSAQMTATPSAYDPDAALLAARGAKSYSDLIAMQLPAPDNDAAPGASTEPATGKKFDDGIGKPVNPKGWNPDAQILAARGVSSYEELNSKFRDGKRIA